MISIMVEALTNPARLLDRFWMKYGMTIAQVAEVCGVSVAEIESTPLTTVRIETRSPPPSRPGEFHPEPLTDPDLTLSRHPARATV